MSQQDPQLTNFINSVVLFGESYRGQGFGALAAGIPTDGTRMLNICHDTDPNIDLYSTHTGQRGPGHLTYDQDLGTGVDWIVQNAKLVQ